MSYQDEPQAGGLIDKYWIFNYIVVPLTLVLILWGVFYLIDKS